MSKKPIYPFSLKMALKSVRELSAGRIEVLVKLDPTAEQARAIAVYIRPVGSPEKVEYFFETWAEVEAFILEIIAVMPK